MNGLSISFDLYNRPFYSSYLSGPTCRKEASRLDPSGKELPGVGGGGSKLYSSTATPASGKVSSNKEGEEMNPKRVRTHKAVKKENSRNQAGRPAFFFFFFSPQRPPRRGAWLTRALSCACSVLVLGRAAGLGSAPARGGGGAWAAWKAGRGGRVCRAFAPAVGRVDELGRVRGGC